MSALAPSSVIAEENELVSIELENDCMWRRTPQKKDHPLVPYATHFPNSPPAVGQKTSVTRISDSLPGQISGEEWQELL